MDHLSKVESISDDDRIQMQRTKLVNQIDYTMRRSLFYQRKFSKHGVDIGKITSLADYSRLPFTEKQELREALEEEGYLLGSNQAAPASEIIRIHASSGTTGKPTYVGITKRDARLWSESCARSFWATGVRPSDVVAHCWNYSLFVGGLADHLGCEETGATMVPVGIGQTTRLLGMIKDLKITTINATPSYIFYLGNRVKNELGMEAKELGVKRLIVGGEPGGGIPATRALLEQEWEAKCYELMGMVDIHPIMGCECEYQNGMHFLVPDLVYPEVINEDGQTLPIEPGVRGELVLSHLERECHPLLRFRSHDVIEILGTTCSCGRTGFRFRVIGRTDDMLIVKGVNVYPSAIEDVLRKLQGLTGEFAILLDKPGVQQDRLRMWIEVTDPLEKEQAEPFARQLQDYVSRHLLFRPDIALVKQGELPRYEHKAKRVYRTYLGESPERNERGER